MTLRYHKNLSINMIISLSIPSHHRSPEAPPVSFLVLRLNLRLNFPPKPAKPCAARVCALRLSAVRSEGRSSCSSVLQALNDRLHLQNSTHFGGCCFFARQAAFCHARAVAASAVSEWRHPACEVPLQRLLRSSCSSVRRRPKSRLRRLASDTSRCGSSSKR